MNIRVEDISFHYGQRPVLKNIDIEVLSGEVFALVGPNGSGKTTLLRNISGLLKPAHGAVYFDGTNIGNLNPGQIARSVAAVEQQIEVEFDFTVREIVEMGRIPHRKFLHDASHKDREAVQHAMHETAVANLANRSIHALSIGERQRVWLAMALAQEPRALLLDEPTSHLDIHFQVEILELVQKLAAQKLTVVMAMHDLNLAARCASRMAVLKNGGIVASGEPREVLTEKVIEEVFDVQVRVIKTSPKGYWIAPWP